MSSPRKTSAGSTGKKAPPKPVTGSPDKVILTNKAALKSKYGTGLVDIESALNDLITADGKRGMSTVVIDLGSKTEMARYGISPVSPSDAKANKQAADKVYAESTPAYLMLLGSTDVIPHQPLKNPLYFLDPDTDESDDPDPTVDSDLPYACDAGYSTDIRKFVTPARVVGRLPDLTGGNDPAYLVGLLKTAAGYVSRPVTEYAKFFALTTQVWEKSTQLSLTTVFGTATGLNTVPPDSPPWADLDLIARSHFINCHGRTADPQFYGEGPLNDPVAHQAAGLAGKLSEGTVLSAECCYGAELYDPALAQGQMGMCNTYLREKAYAVFGSSTVAYGPAVGNGQADLICQFFLKHVREGASVGRAALQTRLDYLAQAHTLTGFDLKTLAQFGLMADPSVTPVQAPESGITAVPVRTAKPAVKVPGVAGALAEVAARFVLDRAASYFRREWLREYSGALAAGIAVVADAVVQLILEPAPVGKKPDSLTVGLKKAAKLPGTPKLAGAPQAPAEAVTEELRKLAVQNGLKSPTTISFPVPEPPEAKPGKGSRPAAKGTTAHAPAARMVHTLIERTPDPENPNRIVIRGLEVVELDGVLQARTIFSR